MAKITGLEAKTYQGKPSGFKITLDDGRSGNLQEKESDKGLRIGDEVIVKEIPYTSKAGVTSTLYGLRLNQGGAQQSSSAPAPTPQPPQRPAINVGVGKSIEECKVMCLLAVYEAYMEKVNSGEGYADTTALSLNIANITPILYKEVDAIFGKK